MKQRNKRFSVRVNAHEYDSLVRLANTASMSVSDYSRKRVLIEPINPIIVPAANLDIYHTLINIQKELNAIGHNLNQVTKFMHINQSIHPTLFASVSDTKNQIAQATKIINQIQLVSIGR
jgi:hypothetical protein